LNTAVNHWLIRKGLLDLEHSRIVSLVVETGCSYFESVTYPEPIDIGLRADRIGTSSVTYALGVFRKGAQETAAVGRFVHVTVDRETRRPVPLPEALRHALRDLTP
jgi:acyl-CoA thioester hydrolase